MSLGVQRCVNTKHSISISQLKFVLHNNSYKKSTTGTFETVWFILVLNNTYSLF